MENQITPQSSSEPITQSTAQDTPIPSISSPTQEKSQNKWLIIVPVLLFLIASGVAGFFVYQNYKLRQQTSQPQPTPAAKQITESSPTLTVDPTADWTIYTNTKHGYLLKYPPEFTFVEGPAAGSPPEVFQTWDTISFDSAEFGFSIHVNPGDAHGNPITCSTDEGCKSKVLAVLQKSPAEVIPFSSLVFEKTRTGFKYEISNPLYTTYSHYLVFLENDKLWEISIYNQDVLPNYDLVNKILSTFKFIE